MSGRSCRKPTGCGKSYLACAIGRAACDNGFRTRYIRVPDLLAGYLELEGQGQRNRYINKLANYDLLFLDEWLKDVPDETGLSLMFELAEKRKARKTTIFCSQYKPTSWVERMGESVKAESITDKYVHSAIKIQMGDCNMRQKLANANG